MVHKRTKTVVAAAVIAVAATAVAGIYYFVPGSDHTEFSGPREWVALAVEANPPLEQYDQTSLLTASSEGQASLAGKYPVSNSPEMTRLGDGFAFPAGDRIIVVDKELRQIDQIALPDSGTLTFSASSADHSEAAFVFNIGVNGIETRNLVVHLSTSGASTDYVDGDISGLTICRSGELQWITGLRDSPISARPSVRMDRWKSGNPIIEGSNYTIGTSTASPLSSIVCADDPTQDRGYAIIGSESHYRVLGFSPVGGPQPVSEERVQRLPGEVQAKAWSVHEGRLYWVTWEGTLNSIALTGNPTPDSVELSLNGDVPISATFEENALYIVHYPESDETERQVSEFDLDTQGCKGTTTEITGWNHQSTEAKIKRLGASFVVIPTILPADHLHQVQCN